MTITRFRYPSAMAKPGDFFTRRNYFRTLFAGYILGTVVVTITNLGHRVNFPRTAFAIFIIGLCINSLIWACELLLRPWLRRLPAPLHPVLHVTAAMLGGVCGYALGSTITSLLFHQRVPRIESLRTPLLITLIVSCFAGIATFLYVQLEVRLRETVREQALAAQELELARRIQERLLPPPVVSGDGYRVTARNVAAQTVAGDFYDLIVRSDGTIVVIIADVAGKGVAASLIMASVKSVLPLIASSGTLESMLRALNAKLKRELGRREFVALACAAYDPSTRRAVIANAGLPDPYLVRDGAATPVVVGGARLPLGVREEIEYDSVAVTLAPGDRLLLVTDGLPEAPVGEEEPLGYERFAELAARHASIDALFADVEQRAHGPRGDDWTAVLMEVR